MKESLLITYHGIVFHVYLHHLAVGEVPVGYQCVGGLEPLGCYNCIAAVSPYGKGMGYVI